LFEVLVLLHKLVNLCLLYDRVIAKTKISYLRYTNNSTPMIIITATMITTIMTTVVLDDDEEVAGVVAET